MAAAMAKISPTMGKIVVRTGRGLAAVSSDLGCGESVVTDAPDRSSLSPAMRLQKRAGSTGA
jgi:hypothetical protein